MARVDERETKREWDKLQKVKDKLTPMQLAVVDILAQNKCDEMLQELGRLIGGEYFIAMRKHGISEKRIKLIEVSMKSQIEDRYLADMEAKKGV